MKVPDDRIRTPLLLGALLALIAPETFGQPGAGSPSAAPPSTETSAAAPAADEPPADEGPAAEAGANTDIAEAARQVAQAAARVGGDDPTVALRGARDAFVAAGDFEAAFDPARQVVERLESSGDARLPRDIAQLARIQSELEDFDAAELNYLKAIELVEQEEGEFSISLLEPYQGLGRSYIRDRRFPEAVTALEQAQHISQRNLGLYNISQTELIDDLTTAHLGLGDTVTARELQLERLRNAVRRFGDDSPQTIPFRYALARYYDQSRLREAAREQYERVVELYESSDEAGTGSLLEPLERLMRIELLLGDREDARTRLVDLVDSQPDLPVPAKARALMALGDWAIAKEDTASARSYYLEAHDLLATAPDEALQLIGGGPQMLDFIAPLSPVDRGTRSRRPYTWGGVVLEFDVSADGRASNVEIVEATPAGLMDRAYDRRIRETHFRPRLVDGVPRSTQGVRFTHYFRYYVEEDD